MTYASQDLGLVPRDKAPSVQATRYSIIVCDDDERTRWSLSEHLRKEGYAVIATKNGLECLEQASRQHPDAIIIDLEMPVMDGITTMRRLREAGINAPIIVIADGAHASALEATRLGAAATIPKPFDLREVSLKLSQTINADRLAAEVRYLREKRRASYGSLVGESAPMQAVFALLRELERSDAPTLLVTGESGTGKELAAQTIHASGPRKDDPFVELDCSGLSEAAVEAELFGHERATPEGRTLAHGLLELAHKGTLLLDEVSALSHTTQAKLVRALESRRFQRVGGSVDLPLEAAIIATSSHDLAAAVEEGRFRQDLFQRLSAITVAMPPLRARTKDLPTLIGHFLDAFRQRLAGRFEGASAEALHALESYPWPGNVRELRNMVERIVTLHRDASLIEPRHLPSEIRAAASPGTGDGTAPFMLPPQGVDLEIVEKSLITQALDRVKKNQTQAAKLLGITRYALRYRMEKFGLKD